MSTKRSVVWKFGDNINTDLMAPGRYMNSSLGEMKMHVFELVNPCFSSAVKPGDVIVAGQNFGCGSSREEAPSVLKSCGISAVIAESFARIFFRNSIAVGLPVLTCRGVSAVFQDGDTLELDLDASSVTAVRTGTILACDALSPDIKGILLKGGILPVLKEISLR
jgi:3-isopropylmalate/(R)-2-methylmalate dehydratase small subunit